MVCCRLCCGLRPWVVPCVEAVGCRSLSSEISLKGYGLTDSMVGCGFVMGGGLGGEGGDIE